MKNKWRFFVVTLAVVLCMTAFSVTAYAGGGDMVDSTMGDPTMETPTATTQPENTNTGEQTPNEQTLTVNVTENADGSHTVTIGDRSWTLPAKREQAGTVVNVRTYLNLRTGPGTDYTVIGRLLNGAEVKVLEESNGWYKVVVPEQTGYVYGKYLEVLNTEMRLRLRPRARGRGSDHPPARRIHYVRPHPPDERDLLRGNQGIDEISRCKR